eukprot:TRINITY_DN21110_c0_g1_i1.p1 TRINITY_DN21110_c0_g1~~TRINITY_DN21110_c0_g1_i1.p1  ORF type:complete len:774 (+),score=195.79 TRINITY_DN21110_c0_g1_i1:25-2322(+)
MAFTAPLSTINRKMSRLAQDRKLRFKQHKDRSKERARMQSQVGRQVNREAQHMLAREIPPSPLEAEDKVKVYVAEKESAPVQQRRLELQAWQQQRQEQKAKEAKTKRKPFVVPFPSSQNWSSLHAPVEESMPNHTIQAKPRTRSTATGRYQARRAKDESRRQEIRVRCERRRVIRKQQHAQKENEVEPQQAEGSLAPKALSYNSSSEAASLLLTSMQKLCMVQPSPLRPSPADPTTAIVTEIPAAEMAALTQDAAPVASAPVEELDVTAFLARHAEQQAMLLNLCMKWEALINEAAIVDMEVADEIRSVVGQARLLLRKKMAKYLELCEKTAQEGRATSDDLDGYWDGCVQPQIDDVNKRFDKLDMCKQNGWVIAQEVQPTAPKKKKARKAGGKKQKPTGKKAAPRASTRDFLRKMRAKAKADAAVQEPDAAVSLSTADSTGLTTSTPAVQSPIRPVADAFARPRSALRKTSTPARASRRTSGAKAVIMTPIHASRADQEALGSDMVLMPVRRSRRTTPSKYRQSAGEQDIRTLLAATNHAYKPNPALEMVLESPSTRQPLERSASTPADCMQTGSDSPHEPLIQLPQTPLISSNLPISSARSSLSQGSRSLPSTPVCGTSRVDVDNKQPVESMSLKELLADDYPLLAGSGPQAPTPPPTVSDDLNTSINLIQFTPAPRRPLQRQSAVKTETTGSVRRFATVTPSRRMRAELGTDVIITPVRRSARNATRRQSAQSQMVVDSVAQLPRDLDFGYVPNAKLQDLLE